MKEALKPVEWVGHSLKRARSPSPPGSKRATSWKLVQHGMEPSDWKPMTTVGPGVNEIRIHVEGERRVFHVARLRHAVYVLHVFRKKSRKTSTADIDLAGARFREALRMEALKICDPAEVQAGRFRRPRLRSR